MARRLNFLHHLANMNNEEMLYKFFIWQWEHPSRNDWTEQVRADMVKVGMPATLEFLTSKSKNAFKGLVKNKIKAYEFSSLIQERGSKTVNLKYTHLHMQEYLLLENMTKNQAIALFKFRTRMAPFVDNFRAGKRGSPCPLCLSHLDSQEESFNCVALNKVLVNKGELCRYFYKQDIRRINSDLVQHL